LQDSKVVVPNRLVNVLREHAVTMECVPAKVNAVRVRNASVDSLAHAVVNVAVAKDN
jgi:hypothetical protein